MATIKRRTVASMKRDIDRAWYELSRLCDRCGFSSRALDRALELELADERAHRRMGKRFTDGRCGYRLSAEYAAKLFVIRWVLDAPETLDVAFLAGVRAAVPVAYGVRGQLDKAGMWASPSLLPIIERATSVDYSEDVAL
jgi:hypothetical protein